ncbi:hypothetical protein J6590_091186, partial [Homalodisca vitripennis]
IPLFSRSMAHGTYESPYTCKRTTLDGLVPFGVKESRTSLVTPERLQAHPNYYMCTGVFASHSTKINLLHTLYIANPSAYLRALNSTADPC